MSNSILKSHIFRSRNHLEHLWLKPSNLNNNPLHTPRRFTLRPLVPQPSPHRLLTSPLPVHHSFCSRPPLHSLLRPRLSRHLSIMSSVNSEAAPTTPAAKTVRVMIKGRVQGVFFRNWTIDNAQELALKGWVRNRRDGSVEALFSGIPDKVEEMEQRCRRGPPDAMVTALQAFPSTDDPGTGFERKPTV